MFQGADVDGLDQIATVTTAGADATDAVKVACEALADALVFTGPAGAQFATYLKTVVIPWMNVVAQSLRAFSAVLKAASTVQRAVSAGAPVDTSNQPKYQGAEQLPAGDTRNYPTMTDGNGASSAGTAGGDEAATADGCGKDEAKDGNGAATVQTADTCDKDGASKPETVAVGNEKETVKPENLAKDGDGGASDKDGDGGSSAKDPAPKPPAKGGGDPELEFLGSPLVDEHAGTGSANVMKVNFFGADVDGPGGLDVQTGLAIGLAGAGALGLAKLAYGKRKDAGATTVDASDEPPAKAGTSGDTFAGNGHNASGTGYGAPVGIDAFPGAGAKATTQDAVVDKLVSVGVDSRGQFSGAAAGGLGVGGYAGLAHGLDPGRGVGDVDVDGLAARGTDQADQKARPVGNDQLERQSGHGAATVAPVWPDRG